MAERKPSKIEFLLLRWWHAWAAGSFLVAYLTADEDTYAMHLFAGYFMLAAIAARLLAGLLSPARSPLRLSSRKGRPPLFVWFAAAVLLTVGLSAVSGVLADGVTWLEDPHEAVSQIALLAVLGHAAVIVALVTGRRLLGRLSPMFTPSCKENAP